MSEADTLYHRALEQARHALENLREAARLDRRAGNDRYHNFRLLMADSALANAVCILRDDVPAEPARKTR